MKDALDTLCFDINYHHRKLYDLVESYIRFILTAIALEIVHAYEVERLTEEEFFGFVVGENLSEEGWRDEAFDWVEAWGADDVVFGPVNGYT